MTFLETYINSSLIISLSARPEINRSAEGKWWGGGGGGGGGGSIIGLTRSLASIFLFSH